MSDVHSVEDGVKEWTVPLENVLASWADMAACYIWLHDRAYRKFKGLQTSFSIPIIVLSTLTGTANFGIGSIVPGDYMQIVQISIGLINIFAGILGTLQSFFRYAENSESHLNAMQGWSKFHRTVTTELSVERLCRKNANAFFKNVQITLEQLMDGSPMLPINVIASFKDVVSKSPPNVVIPTEIRDEFDHTNALKVTSPRSSDANTVLNDVIKKSSETYLQDLVKKILLNNNSSDEKDTVISSDEEIREDIRSPPEIRTEN